MEMTKQAEREGPAPPAVRKRSSYIPTLDGWRALAILSVLLDHNDTIRIGWFSTDVCHDAGMFGVYVFFAISGLLICGRLLDEEELTGALHLKNFYVRRVLRIQPPALLYVAVVTLLTLVGLLPAYWIGIWASLLLVRNYIGNRPDFDPSWPTGQFWSLSVEEHFYLFLPFFLSRVRRFRVTILLCLASLSLAWRLWATHHLHLHPFQISARTGVAAQMLLLPAAMAILLRRPGFRRRSTAWLNPWPIVLVSLFAVPYHARLHPLVAVLPTMLVLSTLQRPSHLFSRFLELAPMRALGRISYSVYLWQQLFLSHYFAPGLHLIPGIRHMWVSWPLVFLCSLLSFHFVEKPCMQLGHRLARPATPGRIV